MFNESHLRPCTLCGSFPLPAKAAFPQLADGAAVREDVIQGQSLGCVALEQRTVTDLLNNTDMDYCLSGKRARTAEILGRLPPHVASVISQANQTEPVCGATCDESQTISVGLPLLQPTTSSSPHSTS